MGDPFMWTGTELINSVRGSIGDPTNRATQRFEDADIVLALNRAIPKLAKDVQGVLSQTVWECALTQGTREYTAPAGFLYDRHVELEYDTDDVRTLTYMTIDEYRELAVRNPEYEGVPYRYGIWRKLGQDDFSYNPPLFILWPNPSAEVDTKKLRVWGFKLPDKIETTNLGKTVEVDPRHCEALVAWAAKILLADDNELALSRDAKEDYYREVTQIKGEQTRRSRSRHIQLKPRPSILAGTGQPIIFRNRS